MFFSKQLAKLTIDNIFAIAVIMATSVTQASVTTYQPGEVDAKDVWVQPSHAGVGDNDVLHVWKSSSVGGFKSLYEIPGQVPYIIPVDGDSTQISSATLNLYVLDTEGGGHNSHAPGYEGLTVPIEVTAMANPWEEETLVGGTPEAIQFWNNSVAAIDSSITHKDIAGGDIGGWVSFEVTNQVRSWVDYELSGGLDGLPYYGFLIEATEEIRASDGGILLTAYHSSAVADASLRPYLEVTTVPIPTAAWLFGSGLLGLIRAGRRSKK